jgi:hypothetical protein
VSNYMGKQFEELSAAGEKVGETSPALAAQLLAMQEQARRQREMASYDEEEEAGGREGGRRDGVDEDTSCSAEEEGQSHGEHPPSLRV